MAIDAPLNQLPAATGSGKFAYDSGSNLYALASGLTTDGRKVVAVLTSTTDSFYKMTAPISYTGLFLECNDSANAQKFAVDGAGGFCNLKSDGSNSTFTSYSYNSTGGGGFLGYFSRGSQGTPAVPQANDTLVSFAGGGYSGSALVANKAIIKLFAEELWSATAQGTYITFETTTLTTTTRVQRVKITGNGNVVLNAKGSAVSTGATDGFTYLPNCAGVPTGSPTAYTGSSPTIYDSTSKALWIHDGTNWATTRRGNVTSVTSATTLTAKDDFVVATPNNVTPYTITLPASSSHKGRNVIIKAQNGIAGTITIAIQSGDFLDNTLNGTTTINSGGITCINLFSDGSGAWWIISKW